METQDWMIEKKMQSILVLVDRDFSEEEDVKFARQLRNQVLIILASPDVVISEECHQKVIESFTALNPLLASIK